jgi:hypothetical protein
MESLFKLGLVLVLLFRELQSGPVSRELAFFVCACFSCSGTR